MKRYRIAYKSTVTGREGICIIPYHTEARAKSDADFLNGRYQAIGTTYWVETVDVPAAAPDNEPEVVKP